MDRYAVIGNPIHHSLSPQIHSLFAKQTHQNIIYTPILVPLDGLAQTLTDFQAQGGKGVNITLPFKHQAYALVDTLSERAALAQAVNTIKFNNDGSRFGDNTDGIGLVRDITLNHQITIHGKRILILGAGGAVRGIIQPLLSETPELLVIANRTEHKAHALAHEFESLGPLQASALPALTHYSFDVVINGTSASLQNEMLDLPFGILGKHSLCYEMVYGKGMTPFMHWAKEQNAALVVDGLGMLVEQAAEAFYLWRNARPDTRPILDFMSKS